MKYTSAKLVSCWKWVLGGAALIVALGWGYGWLYPAYEPPVQPLQNAYHDLASLGDQVAQPVGFYGEMPDAAMAKLVATNAPMLDKARRSLRQPSVVALDWQADEQWFPEIHEPRIGDFRQLATAFAIEGFEALKKNDSRLAIQCGLDNLLLAQATSRGGLGSDWLTGAAVYATGLGTLREACPQARRDDCQRVLNNLPVMSDWFDPPPDITEREWHFWRRINGPYQTFRTELKYNNNRMNFERELGELVLLYQASTDLLRFHYAIRLYCIDHDELPSSLGELLGGPLEALPRDPFSGQDFVYLPGQGRYILYSVGLNRIDDGGLVDDEDRTMGDLVLEPSTQTGYGSLQD